MKSALRLTSGVVGLLMLGLGVMPALAIPEADARKKLDAVAVYILVTDSGNPSFDFYQGSPDQLLLPMYMKEENAREAQKELEEKSGRGIQVSSFPLNLALERSKEFLEEIRKQDNNNKGLFPKLIPDQANWDKAQELLLAQGLPQDEIVKNLHVPVFFTEPPISITLPGTEETKIAFFFSYSQLQEAKNAIPDFEGEERALDLNGALGLMIRDEEDRFFFMPTEDTIGLLEQQQQSQPPSTQPTSQEEQQEEEEEQEPSEE